MWWDSRQWKGCNSAESENYCPSSSIWTFGVLWQDNAGCMCQHLPKATRTLIFPFELQKNKKPWGRLIIKLKYWEFEIVCCSFSPMVYVYIYIYSVRPDRTSSGKMLEAWSSPSLALTSPQTWVSGPQAKFLSPPMSASPKLRVTRRCAA